MRRVCGLDVHKDSIYMCILYENGSKIESVFGVLTPELDKLRDLLVSHHVCEVALESTSIYWIPIWNILSVDFSLKLVNPYFIKQLHKHDEKQANHVTYPAQESIHQKQIRFLNRFHTRYTYKCYLCEHQDHILVS
jgi:transposase